MAAILSVDDLTPFVPDMERIKGQAMIEDALALAARVAPCVPTDAFTEDGVDDPVGAGAARVAAAKAIIRGAVLRWHEAGTGAFQSKTTGPFGETYDTRQTRRGMFWPSEIEMLQELCAAASANSGAFTVDTLGLNELNHSDICALYFGGLYCSCGAVLTNGLYPLYEV